MKLKRSGDDYEGKGAAGTWAVQRIVCRHGPRGRGPVPFYRVLRNGGWYGAGTLAQARRLVAHGEEAALAAQASHDRYIKAAHDQARAGQA